MIKICWLTIILIVQGLQVSSGESLRVRASKGSRDLIIGGTDADPKKFPFFSWLNFQSDSFSIISSCGGTLINPDVVMTAAQCIYGIKNIDVWVNSTSRKFSQYEYLRKAKQIVPHPKFSPSKNGNDIGLIFLDTPVKNVPLARLNRNISVPGDVRSLVTAVGFGRTSQNSFGDDFLSIYDDDSNQAYPETLKMASFYTVTQRSCLKTLGSWKVHESNICASEGSNGVCLGDVGGPLIHPRASSQGYAQIGIISSILSSSCVSKGVPQLFTDVAKFADWIDQTICKFSKSKPKSCSKA